MELVKHSCGKCYVPQLGHKAKLYCQLHPVELHHFFYPKEELLILARFGILIDINKDSICKGIQPNSELSALLHKTKLIIWDEAPMMSKFCFVAIDRSMRDALHGDDELPSTLPFAGNVVVFSGDFRQILPVIPKGT